MSGPPRGWCRRPRARATPAPHHPGVAGAPQGAHKPPRFTAGSRTGLCCPCGWPALAQRRGRTRGPPSDAHTRISTRVGPTRGERTRASLGRSLAGSHHRQSADPPPVDDVAYGVRSPRSSDVAFLVETARVDAHEACCPLGAERRNAWCCRVLAARRVVDNRRPRLALSCATVNQEAGQLRKLKSGSLATKPCVQIGNPWTSSPVGNPMMLSLSVTEM